MALYCIFSFNCLCLLIFPMPSVNPSLVNKEAKFFRCIHLGYVLVLPVRTRLLWKDFPGTMSPALHTQKNHQ